MAGERSDLAGRVAVVTGASSGIGSAVARALAGAGAALVVGARRLERLEALADELTAAGGRVRAVRADVTRAADMDALASAAVDAFGGLDVWVANAGIMPLSPVEELRVEDWDRMVDVNVKGVLHGVAAALPRMFERGGGHLVTVGSVAGRRPFPGGSVYSATKFAVRALMWGLQLELSASRRIRCTDIQPGVVDTELTDHIPDPDRREGFEGAWRDKAMLRPEDVAAAVLYAVAQPDGVNVNEILVRPTDQWT